MTSIFRHPPGLQVERYLKAELTRDSTAHSQHRSDSENGAMASEQNSGTGPGLGGATIV